MRVLLALLPFALPLHGQTPYLVKDINTTLSPRPAAPSPNSSRWLAAAPSSSPRRVRGLRAGTAAIQVDAPPNYPGAVRFFANFRQTRFDAHATMAPHAYATAPFTGERPTGTVTIRAGGPELTRVPMAAPTGTVAVQDATAPLTAIGPGVAEGELLLPAVAEEVHRLTIVYSGDARYGEHSQNVTVSDARRRSTRH